MILCGKDDGVVTHRLCYIRLHFRLERDCPEGLERSKPPCFERASGQRPRAESSCQPTASKQKGILVAQPQEVSSVNNLWGVWKLVLHQTSLHMHMVSLMYLDHSLERPWADSWLLTHGNCKRANVGCMKSLRLRSLGTQQQDISIDENLLCKWVARNTYNSCKLS